MAQFVKGAARPGNAGRKPGSANRTTPVLKDALLLAGCVAGNRLVELEIIERHARNTAENDSPESAGELKQAVEEHGSLVGYLSWMALEYPTAFASLLGRVLPLQVRVDSHKDVVYRTVEEIQKDIDALNLPMDRIAPLLLDKYVSRERDTQIEEASDAVLDDTEVDRSREDN
jgi:hypothetical protein